jgi:hypothetical protein
MDEKNQEILLEIRDKVIRIETKIEDYGNVREKLDKAYGMSYSNKEDIAEMKDGQRWLWRTTIGGFILAAIALLFKWGGKA